MTATVTAVSPLDPGETDAVGAAAQWLSGLIMGSLTAALCVIAIAFVGLLMFSGRLPVRTAFKVVLGCFILLGAPLIASALLEFGTGDTEAVESMAIGGVPAERMPVPQSTYDPYAGASLRQD